MNSLQSLRTWSPLSKVAGVEFLVLLVLLPVAFVRMEPSRATNLAPLKSAESTTAEPTPTATQSEAPIDRRSVTPIALAASESIGVLQDDAWGQCPAFSHRHPTVEEALRNPAYAALVKDGMIGDLVLDGLCHDDNELPIGNRTKLPKPQFKPDPEMIWL